MPDPTIVGIGAEASNTSTGAVTLTAVQPSGLRNGDLLLVVWRQDYQHTSGSANLRSVTAPTGQIAQATSTAANIGGTNTQRVSLAVWAIVRNGAANVSVSINAGAGIASLHERLFIIGMRNASTIRNAIGQSSGATSWPTTAQTITVGAGDSAALSIITNRSTTAQTLSTANGFTVEHSDTDQPAVAVAYRTVDTPSQAAPQWTGSGNLRAQTSFEVVYGPDPYRPRRGLGLRR